jgi:acyl-CoA thioesterase FadM
MDKWHYEMKSVVASTDCDASYECKLSSLFNVIQRTTVGHANALKIGRDEALEKYHGAWMALRIRISLTRALKWGESLRTVASIRKPEEKRLYWDCDFYVGEEHVGESNTIWVLVDREAQKTMSLAPVAEFPQESPAGSKTIQLSRLTFPANMELYDTRQLYYSDTDINGHVNNARYVDLACDAAELHKRPQGVFLQEIQMSYIGECRAGEKLGLYRGKEDGFLYIHGVGPDQTDRFDCRIRMSSPVGLDE